MAVEKSGDVDFSVVINTDRGRNHPDGMWERSLFQNGRVEELAGKFKTVAEALAAGLL
jgi:hypothetical protein